MLLSLPILPTQYPEDQSKQEQDEKLEFLLTWVGEYYTRDGDRSQAAHKLLFDKYDGTKQKLVDLPGPGYMPHAASSEN